MGWVSWKMKNLWNEKEEGIGWERERETSTSITSPLFHYRSGSEGWWRVGQFPQTPSGCPWKWQIVRLIVLGSWPFQGNEPLYLEQKSIKALHFHSALSSLPIQWGMAPVSTGMIPNHSKCLQWIQYLTWWQAKKSSSFSAFGGHDESVSNPGAWQEGCILFFQFSKLGMNCTLFYAWYRWSKGHEHPKNSQIPGIALILTSSHLFPPWSIQLHFSNIYFPIAEGHASPKTLWGVTSHAMQGQKCRAILDLFRLACHLQ